LILSEYPFNRKPKTFSSNILVRFVFLKLTGPGMVAYCTSGKQLALNISPEKDLFTSPYATVAWSAPLKPSILTFNLLKTTLIGGGTGDTVQFHFKDHCGFVICEMTRDDSVLPEAVVQKAGLKLATCVVPTVVKLHKVTKQISPYVSKIDLNLGINN